MDRTLFDNIDQVFAIEGESMQTHTGRSVVRVSVDGRPHFLKRFWLTPRQVFRRLVAQGVHELAMIDWLNDNGFAGPIVVARGCARRLGFCTRMYFLMREVEGEFPLERYYRRNRNEVGSLITALAAHTARLHDAGFYHCDYSERHLLVGKDRADYRFRQIDLERASVGSRHEARAAADLKTLACSIADDTLRGLIEGEFVDDYVRRRSTAPPVDQFRRLLAAARPTKTFE